MKPGLILVILMLVLSTLACGINIDLPRVNLPKVQTGPTQSFTFSEPLPASENLTTVILNMGAGRLSIEGGAQGLVEGEIKYNVAEWKPTINHGISTYTLEQTRLDGLPLLSGQDLVNDWDVKLGNTLIGLQVNAGAYEGTLDLTGIPLRNVSISDGASQAEVKFTDYNPTQMDLFSYNTGGSQINLTGLGYANFSRLKFSGGAGNYALDFSGPLLQPTSVDISAGVCNLTITIPKGTLAVIDTSDSVATVNIKGSWTSDQNTYKTTGSGPQLTIRIKMGLGNIELIHKE